MLLLNLVGAGSGLEYSNSSTGFRSCFLSFPSGARLELMAGPGFGGGIEDPGSRQRGWAHIAISVGSEEAVDDLTRRIEKAGYVILDSPRHTGDGSHESVILDPDGNRVEVTI